MFVTHKNMMTICEPTPTLWTPPWYATIPDLLGVLLCLFPKNMMMMYQQSPRIRYVESGLFCWRAVRDLYPPICSWFYLPPSKPNTSNKAWGAPFGGWECVLYRAGVSPEMWASPSTCRVLTIDWQVRGMCRCLWYARGLCLCPCVITPRGVTSLPTQEAEYSFSGFIPTTNKQITLVEMSTPGIEHSSLQREVIQITTRLRSQYPSRELRKII